MKRASTVALALLIVVGPMLLLSASRANAGTPIETEFADMWTRYDLPVVEGVAGRSWTLGPAPLTGIVEVAAVPDSVELRSVQYFDKARIEETVGTDEQANDEATRLARLVSDLVAGRTLLGDGQYQDLEPTHISVAGDSDDPNGLTYATIGTLQDQPPGEDGELITTRVGAGGELSHDPALADYGVVGEVLVAETNHRVASIFWQFMNSSGTVWTGSEYGIEPVFPDPYFATGDPLIEPYWLSVEVKGIERDVLLQCFEKRCLTYTPSNPAGWEVESNNVGFHYFEWLQAQPEPEMPDEEPTSELTETPDDQHELPLAVFESGGGEVHSMSLEVAATDATRACGLMHRESLDYDTGMLFVWEADHTGSFWNCNTFVPLTLAWISSSGEILGLTDMAAQTRGAPQDVISYPPPGQYRYVIEANQGWFADQGIAVGDHVDLTAALEHGDTNSDTLCQELGLACQ